MSDPLAAFGDAKTTALKSATIEFRNVSKRFGSIQALSDISFRGYAGTVHAITGENGAGKSTRMKLLAGVHAPDAGEILLNASPIAFQRTSDAREAGISTVFQELTLLPHLTIAENLFLGREPRKFGLLDRKAMRREARYLLGHVGIDLDVDLPCGDLTVSERHMVEIAKGAAGRSDVVIYDEPTVALDGPGVDKLEQLIEEQKQAGKLIFYISHRLDEIFRFCDTTTVLKDGRHVTTLPTEELTHDTLVGLMVGRELSQLYPERGATPAGPGIALRVTDLVAQAGRPPVTFEVRQREIVGLAGIEGQGQREIIRTLVGLSPVAGGKAHKIDGEGTKAIASSAVATMRAGIGFIPEDRNLEGLYHSLSIEENISLGMLRTASMVARAAVDQERVATLMNEMNVRARDEKQAVSSLSGGNQQKVMIGRWLASGVDTLLIEEPTRGVDVGAKSEIYRLLREFADSGGAVLITSSELTEHLGFCDRIIVVHEGAIVADVPAANVSEETVMRYALMGQAADGASA